jgi:anti-sigma factor RsiW
MNCPLESRNPEMLVAFAAGELDREAADAVGRHLETCSACRELAAAQNDVWNALDLWEAPPVSADFDRRLYQRIQEQAQPSWWERVRALLLPMPIRHAMPLAAAACLLLMATFIVQNPRSHAPLQPTVEAVHVDQVENALDDMDMLSQFNATVQPDTAHGDTM